jgi:hypothetical protein
MAFGKRSTTQSQNIKVESIIDETIFTLFFRSSLDGNSKADYESSPNFNETDYNHFQPHVRSGYGGYRERARYRYGNIITQIDRDPSDYPDERYRESDRSFYDNKHAGHYKMHG